MNAAPKLAAFALALTAVFGASLAVGSAAGPIDVAGSEHQAEASSPGVPAGLPGLSVATDGYRLVLDSNRVSASTTRFGFRIVDDAGLAVTSFDVAHERLLHLIVVSRNLVDYAHLHPTIDPAGTWEVDLPMLAPGSYRVFADFVPGDGAQITLGADIVVEGAASTVAVPEPAIQSTVDGYDVTIEATPTVGDSNLLFGVRRGGDDITTDAYLGEAGHLVVVRTDDLAFLHVHPDTDVGNDVQTNADVAFVAGFPSAGRYRLFLEFAHGGAVHTAAFTLDVPIGKTSSSSSPPNSEPASHDEGGH